VDKESSDKIAFFKAFNKCQGTLNPVKADSENPHFGNRYPSLAAVMDAVRPFIEEGFSFIHEAVVIEGKPYLRTSMVYNGYERVSNWPLVDDGNPQHTASASTYAKRYNISGLTGLVIDSDDDGNAAAKATPAKTANPTAKPVSQANANGHEVHTFVPGVVTSKSGQKNGKPWTSYAVKLPSGDFASTFDEGQGKILTEAKAGKRQVRVSVIKKGEYKNIAQAELVPAGTEDEPQYEEAPFA
jgi:hypothetical protein